MKHSLQTTRELAFVLRAYGECICSVGTGRYSQEAQFRFFFPLYCSPTRQSLQTCLKEMMCNSWGKTSLFVGRDQLLPQPVDASAPLIYLVALNPDLCICVCLIRQQNNNNRELLLLFFSFTAAVAAVSDIADQANDSLKDGVSVGLACIIRGTELRTIFGGIFKPDQLP